MKRKNIIILVSQILCMLGTQNGFAQLSIGDVVTTPIASPSMASLSSYSDVPVSIASGMPEVSIPLLNIPLSKGITYPISLSYNIKNYEEEQRISDVGAGWSFFGTGVIYKKIIGDLDECYDRTSLPGHITNEFDDVYYYNLPGASGKFRIKRDVSNNTFTLINLSPNHAKIEYTRDSNTVTFKASDFTVTTDNGYKYTFSEFDYGQFACPNYEIMPFSFKSAYFLTRIVNPIGVEIATLEYEKKRETLSTGTIVYQYCKLKTVKTRNGEVTLEYAYDENLKQTVNDPFSLQKILMKDLAGNVLYSYGFNYTIPAAPADVAKRKRVLNFVRKNDKNGLKSEQTNFVYSDNSLPGTSGNYRPFGILEKVIMPTGGVTHYVYEKNEQYFDYNDPSYLEYIGTYGFNPNIQYESTLLTASFNTSQTTSYNFNVPGDVNKLRKIKFSLMLTDYTFPDPGFPDPNDPFYPQLPQPVITSKLVFTIKKGTQVIKGPFDITGTGQSIYEIVNYPGNYTLEVTSVDGAAGAGNFRISGYEFLPGPYRNSIEALGGRVKNIKYYNNFNDALAQRTINYEYDSFDLVNSSSGYLFYNERDSNADSRSSYILYKNVKVSETGRGYTKYRFKNSNDYPKYQNGGTALEPTYFWPYYTVTKGGLPEKEEVYDEQNNLLVSKESEYEMDYYSAEEYNMNTSWGKMFTKPAYIKKTSQKEKVFYPGNKILETQTETEINPGNFKPAHTKSTLDGDLQEKLFTYAQGLTGYTHLENAYITGIPVIVEEKQNGKILSKATTLYGNSSLLPTSILSTNIADGSTRETMRMELYDDKGNLLQYTTAEGLTVAMVYGYNKTSVIAKIEGAAYNQIVSLAAGIITASDNDVNSSSETTLITALDNFRKNAALANYQISTYTYDPLLGITSMTPPSGLREIYQYDDAGRLKTVKRMEIDAGGNTLYKTVKEYQYNYKP
ncbi:hypothetical protein [Chryseobacterium sp.]|uniref:hypothetical protein n=1 Tax=Chryseobacterium sp. TaxID=1871047 RepID=UPI0025BAAE96|nr:hypothetical protein [Chryseobacterium sp.]